MTDFELSINGYTLTVAHVSDEQVTVSIKHGNVALPVDLDRAQALALSRWLFDWVYA